MIRGYQAAVVDSSPVIAIIAINKGHYLFTGANTMNVEDMPLASLSAVKARDKQRWLNLFEADATIEDPVGVSPTDPTGKGHIGIDAISAFYDTFPIDGGEMGFEIHNIIARGNEAAVDLTLSFKGADGSSGSVKALNIYKASKNGKIASLRSFW
jgi:steroid delta-isomerase